MDKRTRTCNFEGCDKPERTKGLCTGHYSQILRGQELRPLRPGTPEERFWAKVNKSAPNGCWEWTGAIIPAGYGTLGINGKTVYAHRFSWELANGAIPIGLVIDHRCAVTHCVNPAHLRAVTHAQNLQHRSRPYKGNTSGVRGVTWDKNDRAWMAKVTLNGRTYHGGRYSTIGEAAVAAQALRDRLFTHDDHDQWAASQAAPPNNDAAA